VRVGGKGKIGSEVASSAQLRGGETHVGGSVVMGVWVLAFMRDGGEVWIEDDTLDVTRV
jgi:hypothetical protein